MEKHIIDHRSRLVQVLSCCAYLSLASATFCTPALANESFVEGLPISEGVVKECSTVRRTSCRFRHLDLSSRGFEKRDLDLVWVEMSDTDFDLLVAPTRSAVDPTRRRGPTLEQLFARGSRIAENVAVVMNGSFAAVDTRCQPEGLEVSQGNLLEDKVSGDKTLDRYQKRGGYLFQTNEGELGVEAHLQHASGRHVIAAVQSPVLLLQDGKIHGSPNHTRRQHRLAIGIDDREAIHIVLAYADGLTVRELADFLLLAAEEGGPGLSDALLLEGYPAGVFFPERKKSRFFGVNAPTSCVPNLLLFQTTKGE